MATLDDDNDVRKCFNEGEMNLIVLSRMYPRNCNLQIGTFVQEQVQALKCVVEGSITVISPIPWSPRFLWYKKKWREYGQVEKEKNEKGIKVYHPRYIQIPIGLFNPLGLFNPFQGLFMYFSVRSLIKKITEAHKGVTILHSHTIFPEGLAVALLKRTLMMPHICTIHGGDINFFPFKNKLNLLLTKYALKKCDHVVTVSNKLKEKTKSIANRLSNVSVIYNGADYEKFKHIPKELAKQKLGVNESGKIILFVGNLILVKGLTYLINAFAALMEEKKEDVKLFLIGDGGERDNLVSLTKSLKIEDQVSLLGRKHHSEIPLWLNIADIFVLPSLSEGFPTVIPEAMMCGAPVLASNVGGVSEIIVNGKSGILTEPGNIESLKEGLRLLLYNERNRQMISKTAKEHSKKYTWENNALEYIEIYKKVSKN